MKTEKQYQFIKLMSSLTKQGFNFTREDNFLLMNRVEARRLMGDPYVKTPFCGGGIGYEPLTKGRVRIKPYQWADRIFVDNRLIYAYQR